MDMRITFVAKLQASKRVEPGNGALHRPTRFAQSTSMRRADFCKDRFDATLAQAFAMSLRTIATITLNDIGLAQGSTALSSYRGNSCNQGLKLRDVVAIGPCQDDRERDALRVDDEVVLAAELAPVRGIGPGFFPASMARTDELSTSARVKSSSPRRRSSASMVSWIRCQTPASCHATSRRQEAVPEPQPISCGSKFHAIPERKPNTIPVSTARSEMGLRPTYWQLRGKSLGKSGSISDHNSSSINSLGIASCQAKQDMKLTPTRKI
jgi:hypothetical protein